MRRKNMIHFNATRSGYTLVEVIIGIAILTAVLVPLIRYLAPVADLSGLKELQIAYALLRGEAESMYASNKLPPAERKLILNDREYLLRCSSVRDCVLVKWTLDITRDNKPISAIHGLLFVPDSSKDNVYAAQ